MTPQTIRRILALASLALISATFALAQAELQPSTPEPATNLHTDLAHGDWALASTIAHSQSKTKLIIVTTAHSDHRQICHVQSLTSDQLVCKSGFGRTHIYMPEDIVALITPGDNDLRLRYFLGFNIGMGAATWGTAIVAASCVPCAIATSLVALFFFDAATLALIGDGQPERLLCQGVGLNISQKIP